MPHAELRGLSVIPQLVHAAGCGQSGGTGYITDPGSRKLHQSDWPQLTSQFAVLRGMNRASADSNIQLMETMSSQSEAFQAHGRRISGLIEDERCQGRVPSLVTRILNLPPSADDKGNAVRQPPTSLPLPPPADRQGSFTKPPLIGLPKITVDGPRKPLSELRDNKRQPQDLSRTKI